MKWFVSSNGEKAGPFSTAEVLNKLLSNEVDIGALVWRSGLPDWQPLLAHFQKPSAEQIGLEETDSLSDTNQKRQGNIVSRFWQGEVTLPTSYWLVGFLGNALLLVSYALARLYFKDAPFNPEGLFAFYATIWAIACVWAAFQSVGVWRSANLYIRTAAVGKRRAYWGRATQAVTIAQLILLGVQLIFTGAPQVIEGWQIAFQNDPSTPDYSVRVMRNGTEMEISGGFKNGLTDEVKKQLRAYPRVKVLHLNSMGGRIGEAQKLAALITERGLIAYTSGTCASACSLAFAAGRERWLADRARLGYHSGRFAGKESPEAMRSALEEAGLPSAFVDQVVSYSSKDMWYPPKSELLSRKIITGVADNYRFATSGYGLAPSAAEFRERLREVPFYRALDQAAPAQFDTLLSKFQAGYLSGTPEGTLIDDLRNSVIAPLLKSRMVRSSDDLAVHYAELIAEQYSSLGQQDPELCFEHATKGSSTKVYNVLPRNLISREAELGERALKEQGNGRRGTKEQIESAYALVGTRMAKRFTNVEMELFTTPEKVTPRQYKLYCDMAAMMFQEIAKLKAQDGGYLMRDIFSQ